MQLRNKTNVINHVGKRYHTKTENFKIFEDTLISKALSAFECENNISEPLKRDEEPRNKAMQCTDIEKLITKFTSSITAACDAAFRVSRAGKRVTTEKSVPWWTSELTLLRRKALALRRRYQRTKNDDALRQGRKLQYHEGNPTYQAKLQQQKIKSWNQFCSQPEDSNPWNAVYKLASGRLRNKTTLTTLQTPNGTYTIDMNSTIKQMTGHFTPEDNGRSDSEHHKRIRQQITEAPATSNDEEFTQ